MTCYFRNRPVDRVLLFYGARCLAVQGPWFSPSHTLNLLGGVWGNLLILLYSRAGMCAVWCVGTNEHNDAGRYMAPVLNQLQDINVHS
jgi:hypothetical protein